MPDQALIAIAEESLGRPPSPAVERLVKHLRGQYGEAVQAVLFYGSCLHQSEDLNGLFDLYVLVNRYQDLAQGSVVTLLGRLLPPNVYYMEAPYDENGEQTIRAKYGVLTLADLKRLSSLQCFHSYFWARFCQPSLLAYAKNSLVAQKVSISCAQAILTFTGRVLPMLPENFTAGELWQSGLSLTYRSELRPEKANRPARLFQSNSDFFERVTGPALEELPTQVTTNPNTEPVRYRAELSQATRNLARFTWALRRIQGKFLSIARLIKATMTFAGGVDYIVWKIERHSGVKIEVSPFLRKHPVLAMFVLARKLFQRGAVK